MSIKNILKKILYLSKEEKKVPIYIEKNDAKLLDGKVALITGGSGGIGISIAKKMINCGAKVIIAGRNENNLKKSILEICEDETKIRYIILDVAKLSSIEDSVDNTVSIFGKIDILVNSAGVMNKNNFFDVNEKEYDDIMSTNTKGLFFMCQLYSRYMIKNGIKGHILNISSAASNRPAWTPYQMSKWAVKGFTLGLADTLLPYGIIVNSIAPGPVATKMIGYKEGNTIYNESNPSKRLVLPDEIANLALYLVSDMGNMIVGDTIYITGGGGVISLHQ